MRQTIRAIALLCALMGLAHGQTQVLCNQGSSKVPCSQPLGVAYVPSLDFSKITTGIVPLAQGGFGQSLAGLLTTPTELGYVHGVTSSLQAQIAALQPLDANLTALAALNSTGMLARTGTNTWALRTITAGSGVTVTNGDGVGGAPTVALTSTSITVTGSTGITATGCGPVALGGTCTLSVDATIATIAGAQIFTNKSISGSTNTLSNIGNGSLVNSSFTLTASSGVLCSISAVSLGGTVACTLDSTVAALLATTQTFTGAKILNALTLGGNAAAGGFKWTGLGAPTAASSDAATATYAESVATTAAAATKTGGIIVIAIVVGSLSAGDFFGNAVIGQGPKGTAAATAPFVLPVAGSLKNCAWAASDAASGTTNLTIFKAAGATNSPSYATSGIVMAVTSGNKFGSDVAHSYSGAQFDTLVVQTSAALTTTNGQVTCQFIPTSP